MLMAYDGLDKLGDAHEHWELVTDMEQLHGIDDGVEGIEEHDLLSDIRTKDRRTRMPDVDQLIRNPRVFVVHDVTDRGLVGNQSLSFDPTQEHS